ncbi:MAG: Rrf2 family transcriptional regulator [Sphingopyxis sp.]|nr:Rrf2 family transcriptional regulator [Sphingopyxis sp.]
MRLSNLADYAVVLMSAAARHCGTRARIGAGGAKPALHNAASLSAETGVPLATTQKLLQALVHAGLLRSSRGVGGGVKLARPAATITLADIVEAIEGPIAMTDCVRGEHCGCAIAPDCTVKPHMSAVNDAVRGALAGVPLSNLAVGR